MKLTSQEKALYSRHLDNLHGSGGVDNPDGSRSSLFAMTVGGNHIGGDEGKTYLVPTVWNGKILAPKDAVEKAKELGADKFPSYATQEEAHARYQKLHDFMEKDTEVHQRKHKMVDAMGEEELKHFEAMSRVSGRVDQKAFDDWLKTRPESNEIDDRTKPEDYFNRLYHEFKDQGMAEGETELKSIGNGIQDRFTPAYGGALAKQLGFDDIRLKPAKKKPK